MKRALTAGIIEFEGRCGDTTFEAVEVRVEGLNTAYMMTLALPASSCRGLADTVRPGEIYRAIVGAINDSGRTVEVHGAGPGAAS